MSPPPPLKILAVDNEHLLLWALERAGKGRSLTINTATTAQQALAEIDCCQYDLFLLDFDLNKRGGLELLKTIDAHCPEIPIILMTTSDRTSRELNDAVRASRKHGVWHLLEKPFSLNEMIHLVELIFQDHGKVKICLNDHSRNYSETRQKSRRPHIQSVTFSFKSIIDGEQKKNLASGILTDISDCGLGLLSRTPLEPDQVLSFGDALMQQYGFVVWSNMIDEQTCRAGIRLC